MPKTRKHVNIQVKTTMKHLDSLGLTMDQVKEEVKFLMQVLGNKYFQLLLGLRQSDTSFNFNSQLIERAIYLSKIFRKINKLEGFTRHLKEYTKHNVKDHLFTAKTAAWYIDQGYEVAMEPESTPLKKRPDLLIKGKTTFAVECKTIDANKFYEIDKKKKIADIVFDKVPTCDQLTFELKKDLSPERIKEILNKQLVSLIYMMSAKNRHIVANGDVFLDDILTINDELKINIIYRPTIIGAPEDFPTITFEVILESNETGNRLPGFAFSKGGQTVAIFGPPPDYSPIWNRKRSKSKKQAIPDLPLVVIINKDDVLGNPELHREYFQNTWLTKENSQCSGVGILDFTTLDDKPKLDYFINPAAEYPILNPSSVV